jgi:hypothetical protein
MVLGQNTAAFYIFFTISMHSFYGFVYGAFMTSRLGCVMLSRVLRCHRGGALRGHARKGLYTAHWHGHPWINPAIVR